MVKLERKQFGTRSAVAPIPGGIDNPWAMTTAALLEHLRVSPEEGLDDVDVARRRRQFGANRLHKAPRKSLWAILLEQFRSLIMALLAGAALTSLAFGQWVESLAIVVVIVLNALIGFLTELRAVRSMEALRRLGSAKAIVRRRGQTTQVDADALVPGDIVLIEAGDSISADLRVLEASKLQSDESALTGESLPVAKQGEPIAADTSLAERGNMLFKGTFATRGAALTVVVGTGMNTELGQISALVEQASETEDTPLEKRLAKLGRELIWITLLITATVAVLGIVRGKDTLLMIETGVALAVATIPEGLPIVATLALARGMVRMARRNVLIRRLAAVETLGATNVICTDKTGTLTENRMTVTRVVVDAASEDPDNDVAVEVDEPVSRGSDAPPGAESGASATGESDEPASRGSDAAATGESDAPASREVHEALRVALEVAVLCNNAALAEAASAGEQAGTGDPLELALLAAGARYGIHRSELVAIYPEVREVAFDPDVKMMATCHAHGDGFRVAVKGAPESVMDACTLSQTPDGTTAMTEAQRRDWLHRNAEMAERGLRVLALATKTVTDVGDDPYRELTLVGLVGMEDPPRRGVRTAVAACQEAGIKLVMVTGDQAVTARKIASDVGLVDNDRTDVVAGDELEQLVKGSADQRRRALDATVFARVSPRQKLDLIAIHQSAGEVVAMTGDGVNDAPALRKADIGVAMGQRGTEVAREAADMVLEDDALSSIVVAVAQGRVIFDNIRKFVVYLLSCNTSEVMVIGAASLVNAPLPVLPLQILFLNLVTDVFPALALGVGPADAAVMKRAPRDPKEPLLLRSHWWRIGGYSLFITVSVLGAFAIALVALRMAPEEAVTVSFLTLAFAQLWHVFNMRSANANILHNEIVRNRFVWGALILCVALILLAVYVPLLSRVLSVTTLGPRGWLVVLTMSVVPLLGGPLVRLGAGRSESQRRS